MERLRMMPLMRFAFCQETGEEREGRSQTSIIDNQIQRGELPQKVEKVTNSSREFCDDHNRRADVPCIAALHCFGSRHR
jgi:hypothetical protein